MTGVSDRIASASNRSTAIRSVGLDISKAFDSVSHAGLFHKLKSFGISCQIFGLISSFHSNSQFQVDVNGNSSKEYSVNAGVRQGSIFGPTLFLYTLMTFLMMLSVTLLSILMILLSSLSMIRHLICGNN